MKQRFVFLVAMTAFVIISGLISSATAQDNTSKFQYGIEAPYIVLNGDTLVSKSSIKAELVTDTQFEKIADKYLAKTSEGINDLLVRIQTELSEEAHFAWEIYCKRYRANFWIALGVIGLGLIIIIGGLLYYAFAKNIDWDEGPNVIIIAGLIVIVGAAIATLVNLPYLITPEYYVVQDLLGIIK